MKTVIRRLQRTWVLMLKICLYMLLIGIFFALFSIENPQLLRASRTAAVTALTFIVVGLAMTAAYGQFDIGQRKSKPIIYSLGLATIITDIITFIQLSIMNTNPYNNATFRFANIGFLFLAGCVQVVVIVVMTYLGNYIYFRINHPESTCVVTTKEAFVQLLIRGISKYKKQYNIKYILYFDDPLVFNKILECDTVFIYDVPIKDRTEIVEFCYRNLRNIYFNPEISDIIEFNGHHLVLDDISLISSPVKELSPEQRFIKRTMDILVSSFALILTSPIWLICAIAIKCNDGGKVFFKQKRATKGGKVFEVYKFRTMRENVNNFSSTIEDDRITSVGKILRKFRIDELPQILNILKGEMSLVGPRPEMLENVYNYTKNLPEFEYRLRVKAGLTGYAQIAGKYNTSPRDKLILDLMYIENYSIWKDIKLILQTLIVFFKSDSTEAFEEMDEKIKKEKQINE